MILNVKIFDETLVIDTEGMSDDYITFIINIVLDGFSVYRSNSSILLKDEPNFYSVLLELNNHFSLAII